MNNRRASFGLRNAAFTLMEMVTSCLVLSLIMVSLGYGLRLALLSTGNGATQTAQTLAAADLVERVTDDLNLATGFTERSANAVTFTVPDREGGDADANPDTIRYAWWPAAGSITLPGSGGGSSGGGSSGSGSSGGGGGLLGGLLGVVGGVVDGLLGTGGTPTNDTVIPVPAYSLTRQYNDGLPALVARDVRQFDFNYLTRTMTAAPATAAADRYLFGYDAGTNTTPINTTNMCGVTFQPSAVLPAGTTSVRITRVAFYMKVNSGDSINDSSVAVSIWPATSGGVPTGSAYPGSASTPVPEVALNRGSGFQWVEFTFPTPVTLLVNSSARYCLVLAPGPTPNGSPSGNSGNHAGLAAYQSLTLLSPVPPGTSMATRANVILFGIQWSSSNLDSMRYKVYGTTNP